MKKLLAILIAAFALAGVAGTLTLTPGLSEPLGGDGALVEAAVLVSTNASATAAVEAVCDIPVYGDVEYVFTNETATLAWVTNSVIVTNFSTTVTSNYVVTTAYGLTTTNYYTVATNSVAAYVPRPGAPVITTNVVQEVTGYVSVTNTVSNLDASEGLSSGVLSPPCLPLVPGTRILFSCDSDPAAKVTIFLR